MASAISRSRQVSSAALRIRDLKQVRLCSSSGPKLPDACADGRSEPLPDWPKPEIVVECKEKIFLTSQGPRVTKLRNGITVASIENFSPVSRVAVVVKAGSRYESTENQGLTHCLRLAAGLSTKKSTEFGMTRSVEQAGAEFSCFTSREYMFYKVNCLRDNLELVFKTLTLPTTVPAFKHWELAEIYSRMAVDLALMKSQPKKWCFELLHKAAYRDTLGRSLYCPDYKIGRFSTEQMMDYVSTYFAANRLAIVGIGVDHDQLVSCCKKVEPFPPCDVVTKKAVYHGDELHIDIGGDLTYSAVAVEGPGLASQNLLNASVLQHVMGSNPSLKYSCGTTMAQLSSAIGRVTTQPFSVRTLVANYSDSGLFGFTAIAPAKEMEKVLCAGFDHFRDIATGGVPEEDVNRAKEQLKGDVCMFRESCDNILIDLGEQVLGHNCEDILTTQDIIKYIDNISNDDLTEAAKKMVTSKPSMAAVGDLAHCPFMDDLETQ